MDDARGVRRVERLRHLASDGDDLVDRHRTGGDPRREVVALDQLQDQRAVLEAVDVRDVGMIERRQRARLALEPRQPVGVRGERVGEHLDRHVPLQPRVARAIDDTHPARSQRSDDLVGPDAGAGAERHAQCLGAAEGVSLTSASAAWNAGRCSKRST